MNRLRPSFSLLLLTASCTTPDVAPVVDVSAPVVAQPDAPAAEVEVAPSKTPATTPTPTPTTTPTPIPATPTAWGLPLRITGNSKGLRFTTTAHLERTADAPPQLVLDVELHNSTLEPMDVSLVPPRVTIMTTAAPGAAGEGYSGLGMRGEGMGSDVCSPGHGGPDTLAADERRTTQRRVELDPLPWPPGAAFHVTANSSDCRPGRLTLEVADVMVVPPLTPEGLPTLLRAPAPPKK